MNRIVNNPGVSLRLASASRPDSPEIAVDSSSGILVTTGEGFSLRAEIFHDLVDKAASRQ